MFGAAVYTAAVMAAYMQKSELEMKKLSGVTAYPMGKTARGKCPCCGSNQWQQHKGRTICSYCRSAV